MEQMQISVLQIRDLERARYATAIEIVAAAATEGICKGGQATEYVLPAGVLLYFFFVIVAGILI